MISEMNTKSKIILHLQVNKHKRNLYYIQNRTQIQINRSKKPNKLSNQVPKELDVIRAVTCLLLASLEIQTQNKTRASVIETSG